MNLEKNFRLRYMRLCSGTANNQGGNDFDYTVEAVPFDGTNVQPYMTGAQYEVGNSNLNDRIVFQVVHPVYGVLDEFANIASCNGTHKIETYLAKMYVGTIIRLKYIRDGNNVPEIRCNLFRHIKTTETL